MVAGAGLLFTKAGQRPSPFFYKELSSSSFYTAPSRVHVDANNCFNSVIKELVAGAGFEPTTFG
ncbi:hypothetical protein ACVBKF_07075, partial [Shewanella sp. 0m-11]